MVLSTLRAVTYMWEVYLGDDQHFTLTRSTPSYPINKTPDNLIAMLQVLKVKQMG